LAGITRAPFTSAIIVFVMTDRHSVIFFLMLGAIVANIIANWVDSQPFYDRLKTRYIKDVMQNKNPKPEQKKVSQ
jgi:H+/Cl- antiporter ClcA